MRDASLLDEGECSLISSAGVMFSWWDDRTMAC